MKPSICILLICTIISFVANGQAVFRLSAATEMRVNNNVRVVLNNISFENNGNTDIAPFSRFVFTGNTPSVSIGGNGNMVMGELELNKPAGVVQLNRPLSIFTSVIFTLGNLDLNGTTLFLATDPNGQLIGENNNSRVFGNSGILRKPAILNAPVNINPGNIGVFISSSQNLGATTIDRQHYTVNNQNVRRVFHITPATNANLNAALRFQYLDPELGGLDENLLSVWKSATGTGGWITQGGVVDAGQNSIALNGVNDFSWFTMAKPDAALPVILSGFTAACNNGDVMLKWQTRQEQNTAFFEIQSSLDGAVWRGIARVEARGNSTVPVDYGYKDTATQLKYYRLQVVDKDGKFSYSLVQAINCGNKNGKITVYPNPARDQIELTISGINRHSLPVKIINSAGQVVWQQQVTLNNQYRKLSIPIAQFSMGTYFIKAGDEQYSHTITISKQ
jgi:hypothetical protein